MVEDVHQEMFKYLTCIDKKKIYVVDFFPIILALLWCRSWDQPSSSSNQFLVYVVIMLGVSLKFHSIVFIQCATFNPTMSHTTCQMTNPFNSYSSFFSSGSSPCIPHVCIGGTLPTPTSQSHGTRTRTLLPRLHLPRRYHVDEYMMNVDMSEFIVTTMRNRHTRSVTPTPQAEGQTMPVQQSPQCTTQGTEPLTVTTATSSSTTPQPRRRRSSLTQATKPMNAIRSLTRGIGNALHLQMQLPASTPRSRSGSRSLGAPMMRCR